MVTTQVKAESAVAHTTRMVGLAEEAIEAAGRRIEKAKDHLAQAKEQKVNALQELKDKQAELAEWQKVAASFVDPAPTGTAHDAGVLTESNN